MLNCFRYSFDYDPHDIIILVKKRMHNYLLDIHESIIYRVLASISDSYEIIYRVLASISDSYEIIYRTYASIPNSYENILKFMLSNIYMLLYMIKI